MIHRKRKKVVLLGLDGATFKKINPLVKKGYLPAFKKLADKGVSGILKSVSPPSSPPAWNSIYTGVFPIKHGVYDFVKRKENSYFIEPIFSSDNLYSCIWDYLSRLGYRTVAITLPFTYPLRKTNGVIISGLGTPSIRSEFVYPPKLKNEIISKFPKFDIDFSEHIFSFPKDKDLIVSKVTEVTEAQYEVAKWLFKKGKWDLFFLVSRSLDVIQHFFWDDFELIKKFYTQVDSMLGWILDNLDDDTLIVCSDHGFHEVSHSFYVNNWLESEGFLAFKKREVNFPISAEDLERVLTKMGLRRIVWSIKTSPVSELLIKHIFKSKKYGFLFKLDWDKTEAYYLGTPNSLIFLNIKDREPLGSVKESQIRSISKRLVERAKVFTYNGIKPIKYASTTEDLYGRFPQNGPEVVLVPLEGYSILGGYNNGRKIVSKGGSYVADHDENGIYFVYGGKVKSIRSKASIVDIAPTVFSIIDENFSANFFDGKPIVQVR